MCLIDSRCGKSTQVPQYLLDASLCGKNPRVANILCTQPRRISAIAVSERVAEERAEKLGGVVGYQIRLETCMVRGVTRYPDPLFYVTHWVRMLNVCCQWKRQNQKECNK